MKLTFRTRKTGLMANPQTKKKVESRVQNRSGFAAIQSAPQQCVFGVASARWPDGPLQSGVVHGFSLIPVSGVGAVVDEGKTENSGIPTNDMLRGWDDLRHTHRIAQTS